MKNRCCLFLALLLLVAAMTPIRAEEQEDAVSVLLNRLSLQLDAREQRSACLRACHRRVDTFLQKGDYTSLVRARLACSAAREELGSLAAPEISLDEAERLSLMQMNVETAGLEDMASELKTLLQTDAERLLQLESFLFSNAVSLQGGLDSGRRILDGMTGMLTLEDAYDSLRVYALLLPLADRYPVAEFWEGFARRWPEITEQREEWIGDLAVLTEKATTVLEEMKKGLNELSTACGINADTLQQSTQAEKGTGDFAPVAGMPDAFPLPDFWSDTAGRSLHANAEDEGGDELPVTLIWSIPDVSADQFLDYVGQLSEDDMEAELAGSDQEGWKATMILDDRMFQMVLRRDGNLLITYDPQALSLELR